MNTLISIQNVINRFYDDTNIDETIDVPVLTEWAIEGDKMISSYYQFIKDINVLDVIDCRAELPCGTYKVLNILLGDHGCDCGLIFDAVSVPKEKKSFNATTGLLVVDTNTNDTSCDLLFAQVQDNKLVFDGNYNGQKVTIQRLGYKLDDNNFPMVNENHISALSTYLQYKYANRSRFKPNTMMTLSDVNFYLLRWQRLCADARAEDGELNETEKMRIANYISNPLSGRDIQTPIY